MRVQKLLIFAVLMFGMIVVAGSCGSKEGGGVKFNPAQTESKLSNEEREARIKEKRAALAGIDTAVVFGNGIKLTVLSPTPNSENFVTEQMSQQLAMRMLQIASKNGVSGLGTDADFALVAAISGVDRQLTSTAPQKTMLTYKLTLYVAQMSTATVFSSAEVQLTGVGNTVQQAANAAAQSLHDNATWQMLLANASPKIVRYYEDNLPKLRARVQSLIAAGKYEEAYAVLNCVPRQAASAWQYAEPLLPEVSRKALLKQSATAYTEMKNAIAQGQNEYNPEVAACLARIPQDAPEYAMAAKAFDEYMKDLREQAKSKEERDRQEARRQKDNEQALLMAQIQSNTKMAASNSLEMRKQIAMEDAAGKPWKMLFNNVGYSLNNLFFK